MGLTEVDLIHALPPADAVNLFAARSNKAPSSRPGHYRREDGPAVSASP